MPCAEFSILVLLPLSAGAIVLIRRCEINRNLEKVKSRLRTGADSFDRARQLEVVRPVDGALRRIMRTFTTPG